MFVATVHGQLVKKGSNRARRCFVVERAWKLFEQIFNMSSQNEANAK